MTPRRSGAADDYRVAMRRLELLSRTPAELGEARNELDLHRRIEAVTRRTFTPRRAAVYGATSSGRLLVPPGSAEARSLLFDLCENIDAIPDACRQSADLHREIVPYLCEPQIVAADSENGIGALAAAPVLDGVRLLALIVIEADPAAGELTLADLHALSAIASNGALVAQRLRVTETTVEQRRVERDLDLAREIQRRFLPKLDGTRRAVRVAAEYHPAYDIGGDFYDVVDGLDGKITAVIGDVSGKGVPAALLMSRISSDFRRLAREGSSPQALLGMLNQATGEHAPDDSFATAVVIRIDAARRKLSVANAGHVHPLIRRADGTVEEIGVASGLPLGMMPNQSYAQAEYNLAPGDIVLLMTDGVVEALDHDGDRLGEGELRRLVGSAPADAGAIHGRILAAVREDLRAGAGDDLTLLGIEIHA